MRRLLYRIKATLPSKLKWNSLLMMMASATTIIAVVAVLMITFAMNRRFNDSIDRTTEQNNTQIVDNVSDSIDSYLEEMISVSDTISELLIDYGVDKVIKTYHFVLRDDIDTIAVFDAQGRLVMKTDSRPLKENVNIKQQDWFRSVAPGSCIYVFTEPHVQRLYKGEYRWVISLSKGIEWVDGNKTYQGIVLVDLNFNNIKELCSKELGENGYLYIVDTNGKLIYHPRQQMIFAGIEDKTVSIACALEDGSKIFLQDGGRMMISIKTLKNANWRIVGVSPLNGLFAYDEEIRNFIMLVVIGVALIIIVLSITVSFLITSPLHRLMRLMGQVEAGKLDTFSTIRGVYEVNELSTSFNQMVYKIKQLMEQVIEEQKMLRKSELKTLHAQINPHFLYNTLDSIAWMAENGDQENVVKMIAALSQFFRLSLSGGNETVLVKDELKHAENYLVIQKMRYGDQFDYEIVFDDAVLNYKTLKILLQPIVENAIIHGVGNLPYKGKITIYAGIYENKLVFEVKDNGFGINPKKLEHILEVKPSTKSGIGVYNVNQRIQLMYGTEYGLQFESELDIGTTVRIVLPLIKA
ncbi:MAG TPA: histidine kinase [Clostridiaceae bacterium]|nr:histidine kinase [Clostridiaceae bacterium]